MRALRFSKKPWTLPLTLIGGRDTTKGTQGLGLTGRFVYIQVCRAAASPTLPEPNSEQLSSPQYDFCTPLQVRCIQDLPVTIHLDLVTNKKTALRFTLSSIYQSLRSTGTVLRVPLRCFELISTMHCVVACLTYWLPVVVLP